MQIGTGSLPGRGPYVAFASVLLEQPIFTLPYPPFFRIFSSHRHRDLPYLTMLRASASSFLSLLKPCYAPNVPSCLCHSSHSPMHSAGVPWFSCPMYHSAILPIISLFVSLFLQPNRLGSSIIKHTFLHTPIFDMNLVYTLARRLNIGKMLLRRRCRF